MVSNNLNLSIAIKRVLLEDLLGKVIDLTRISDMGDRQHRQFVITIKKEFFDKLEELNNSFINSKDYSVIPTDELMSKLRVKKDDANK